MGEPPTEHETPAEAYWALDGKRNKETHVRAIAVGGKILLLRDVDDVQVRETGVKSQPSAFIDHGEGCKVLRRGYLIEQQLPLKIRAQLSKAGLVGPLN
jgi:hypothetical protein